MKPILSSLPDPGFNAMDKSVERPRQDVSSAGAEERATRGADMIVEVLDNSAGNHAT